MTLEIRGYRNIEELIEIIAEFPGMLLILPTEKKAHYINNQLMSYWESPAVFSLSEFLSFLYEEKNEKRTKISPAEEILIMERILEENWKSLSYFSKGEISPGMASKVKKFFNTAVRENINIFDLRETSEKNADLKFLWEKYNAFLNEKNLIDSNNLGIMGKEMVLEKKKKWEIFALDTLQYLSPLDWEIIRKLENNFSRKILFSDLPQFLPKGGTFFDLLKAFNQQKYDFSRDNLEKCDSYQVFFNPEEEVRAVARDLREKIKNGVSAKDLFVVPAALDFYQPLIREIFPQFDVPFDISKGLPLKESPAAILLKTLLELAETPFSRQLIYRLFSSSLVELKGLEIEELDSFARRFNYNDLEPLFKGEVEISSLLPGKEAREIEKQLIVLENFLENFIISLKENQSYEEYFAFLEEIFREISFLENVVFSKTGKKTYCPQEITIGLRKLFEVLEEAKNLFIEEIPMKGNLQEIAPQVLNRLIAETEFYIPAQAGGVQVTGILNMRGWPGEKVYFIGVTSENFPPRPENNFLIQGKDSSQILREAKLFFHQLIFSSGEIEITVPAYFQGKETQPSPFLKGFKPVKVRQNNWEIEPGSLNDSLVLLGESQEKLTWQKYADPKDLKTLTMEFVRENGKSSEYNGFLGPALDLTPDPVAITALEDYWRCPFYYLMKWILQVGKIEEVEEEEELALFGIQVHKMLELFGEEGGFKLLCDNFSGACLKMEQIVLRVLEEEKIDLSRNLFIQGQYANWLRGLNTDEQPEGVFKRFLREEKKRMKNFSPNDFETVLERSNHYPKFGPFRLKGRVDRLDVFEGNDIMVYDYKTGWIPPGSEIRDWKNLQLPLYILALKNHPDFHGKEILGGYYQLKHRDEASIKPLIGDNLGESFKKNSVIGIDELGGQEKYEEILGEIKKGIDGGNFNPTNWSPEDARCNFCSYRLICRRNFGREGNSFDKEN